MKQKCHLLADEGTGTQRPSGALSGSKCSGLSLCCLGGGRAGTSLFLWIFYFYFSVHSYQSVRATSCSLAVNAHHPVPANSKISHTYNRIVYTVGSSTMLLFFAF